MKIKIFIIAALLFLSYADIKAQYTFLDTTFNKTGPYTRGLKYLKPLNAETRAVAVDALGKIVTVVSIPNSTSFYVFRLKPDGAPDSFDGSIGDSVIITSPTVQKINSLIIQPNGKILIAGHRNSLLGDADMMVMRLNYDGTPDLNFGTAGVWIKDFHQKSDSVTKIALQANGNIIVAGTKDSIGLSGALTSKMVISCLRPDGQENANFQQYISSSGFYNENITGLGLFNDTIYVATNFYNGGTQSNYNSVVKLGPNGNPAWPSPGRRNFTSVASVNDLAVRQDGDVFLGGNDFSNFYLTKIKSNGLINTSVILNQAGIPTGVPLKSMLIDKDGKIILSGQAGTSYILSIKTDENGKLDSTFGVSGQMRTLGASNGYRIFNQSAFSLDHKLLLVGEDVKNAYPSITKVYLRPAMNILGRNIVLPKTPEDFKADVPASWANYTYTWTYTGKYIFYFTAAAGPAISIYFTDSATSGTLICKAYSGSTLISYDEKDIKINHAPTDAYQLAKLKCDMKISNCGSGYIDNFSFSSINNQSTGCSNSGYSDYTRSGFADTLSAGAVYSASLTIPIASSNFNYAGIWIDYNNDGDFNNSDEFVGEGYSSGSEVKVNNIVLKNQPGYLGPKRLRVRSLPDIKITASQSCPSSGDIGETEDYLIVISTQPIIEAPQIITPNDDGKNDFFVIRGVDPVKNNKLTIFDRLGTLKFSSSDYKNNWSGTGSNGDLLVPGTYYYVFTNGKNSIKGFLEIRY
jgi:gliding motility-associated-like protein/uncharacterized delta-60 repeat protein